MQGGTASPALFRLFINDLASELRGEQGVDGEPTRGSIDDPEKMVEDDVTFIAHSPAELQKLLYICTRLSERNRLKFKPAKCVIVTADAEGITQPITLAGQALRTDTEARYLGITVKPNGFTKDVNRDVERKFRAVCSAISSQSFFGPSLPLGKIRALCCKNFRSILVYGATLVTNTKELEDIDRKVLQQYFKAIIYSKEDIPQTLLDRICKRIILT